MASLAASRLRLTSSPSTHLHHHYHHHNAFPPHRQANLSFSSSSTSMPGFGAGLAVETRKERSSFAVRHLSGSLTRAEGLRFAVNRLLLSEPPTLSN